MKKIFYLIPFYNSESTILNCLTSIRSEKYKIEVILINDNSSDNSLQIVNSVKNNLPYVLHVIINKDNLGISKSLNLGIDFALKKNADYLIRLDSDDFNVKERTDYQIDYMEKNPNIIMSTSNAFILKNNKLSISFLLGIKSFLENRFRPFSNFLGSIDLHPTFCIRSKPFRDLGLRYGNLPDKELNGINFPFMEQGMEDLLLINAIVYYYGFESIFRDSKKNLIIYRQNEKGLTPTRWKDINDLLDMIFIANNILYLKKIDNKNIMKLSKAIANHQLGSNYFLKSIYSILGYLIIRIKDSSYFYKLFFSPIFLFLIPRLIIQYLRN